MTAFPQGDRSCDQAATLNSFQCVLYNLFGEVGYLFKQYYQFSQIHAQHKYSSDILEASLFWGHFQSC